MLLPLQLVKETGVVGTEDCVKAFSIPREGVEKACSRFMETQPYVHPQVTIIRTLTFY